MNLSLKSYEVYYNEKLQGIVWGKTEQEAFVSALNIIQMSNRYAWLEINSIKLQYKETKNFKVVVEND